MSEQPRTVAALYVEKGGAYYDLPGVECWDEERDARLYAGPWPVVAHPPCARWGRYWNGGPSARVKRLLGDDGGCFEAAIGAVRRWCGVLEHPAESHAWRRFGLMPPPRQGGWVRARVDDPGWTCCVEQGHYGHKANKATWIYAVGCELPSLKWGTSVVEDVTGCVGARGGRGGSMSRSNMSWISKLERRATPLPFRDLLLSIARSAR